MEEAGNRMIVNSEFTSVANDYDEMALKFEVHWNTHNHFQGLDAKTHRNLPKVLLHKCPLSKIDFYNTGVVDEFVHYCLGNNDVKRLKFLFKNLLIIYPNDQRMFDLLSSSFALIKKDRRMSSKLLIADTERFSLDRPGGPKKFLAIYMTHFIQNKDTSQTSLWVKEEHLAGGFGAAVFKELCSVVERKITDKPEKMLSCVKHFYSSVRQPKTHQEKIMLVNSLLLPFQNLDSSEKTKNSIVSFIDHIIGDPRTNSSDWTKLLKAKEIYLHWKIGQTLEAFFKIISQTTRYDDGADQQWTYRKEFYRDFFESGYIREVWIALGPDAYSVKETFFEGEDVSVGSMLGCSRTQSAMIVKIGDLVISEWSHMGAMRFWKEGDRRHPKFYAKSYQRNDFFTECLHKISHTQAASYGWQQKAHKYIHRETGVTLRNRKF